MREKKGFEEKMKGKCLGKGRLLLERERDSRTLNGFLHAMYLSKVGFFCNILFPPPPKTRNHKPLWLMGFAFFPFLYFIF